MALETGSRLGPYEVVGLLDSGAMGEVYRARDPRLEREVAIKVVPEEIADRRHLLRFEQEARAAGALNHPNVLAVYDVGTHDGAPYVVSELLEGQTLRARLEGGPLPVRKALDYALEIARGLAAAHDKGIVHRDLKPDNVFVTNDGRIKILDFGLAKLTRPTPLVREGDQGTGPRATESGVVLGTVGFMSPEQVRGEAVDHRSDIFSFGALLYEMLTGMRAFRRDSAVETMNAILKEDPPEVSRTGRGISPGLAGLVRRCLEKRAGDRFHSAHDLALALEAASSGLSDPWPERGSVAAFAVSLKRHKRRLLVALAAMVLVAGGLYWGLVRSPAPPGRRDRLGGGAALRECRRRPGPRVPERRHRGKPHQRALATPQSAGHRAQHELSLPGQRCRPTTGGARSRGRGGADRTGLPAGRHPGHRSRARRRRPGDATLGRAIQHQDGRHLHRTGGHRQGHLARAASEAGAQGRDSSDQTPHRKP